MMRLDVGPPYPLPIASEGEQYTYRGQHDLMLAFGQDWQRSATRNHEKEKAMRNVFKRIMIDGGSYHIFCAPAGLKIAATVHDPRGVSHDAGTWETIEEAEKSAMAVAEDVAEARKDGETFGERVIRADTAIPEYADALRALARLARRWRCDLVARTFQFWGEDGLWMKIEPKDEKLPDDAEKWVETEPGSRKWCRWDEKGGAAKE